MQFTVYNLADKVLKKLGVLGSRDKLTSEHLEDVMFALCALLDGWNSNHLMIPFISKFQFDGIINSEQRIYTLGPDGDFAMPRPIDLPTLTFRDTAGTDYPITLAALDNYVVGEPFKETSIGRPIRAWYNPSYPNAELSFEIYPQDTDSLIVFAKLPFDVESCTPNVSCSSGKCYGANNTTCSCDCTTDCDTPAATTYNPIRFDEFISFPPGYFYAIMWNLCVDMAPEYDMSVTQEIAQRASKAVRDLKNVNDETPELRVDRALTYPGRRWNIFSGPSSWGRN